ncbi:unnamed protein product [Brassica napus]|uniref:(rape) hypothetical protein n=1 Tax=Brassica napus TaxID=3708 RepID=A0A816I652_BRANA|nr:unnamed protein product [Brassica napus]
MLQLFIWCMSLNPNLFHPMNPVTPMNPNLGFFLSFAVQIKPPRP